MKKTIIITWLLLSLLATIMFLLIFKDKEYGQWFAIDLITTLVAIGIFVYGIGNTLTADRKTVVGLSQAMVLTAFAVLLLGWTLVMTFVPDNPSIVQVAVGDCVLTLLTVFLVGTTQAGGNVISARESEIKEKQQTQKVIAFSLADWYENLLDILHQYSDTHDDDRTDSIIRGARNIKERIETIPVKKLSDNKDFMDNVEAKALEIKRLTENLQLTAEGQSSMDQIVDRMIQLREYVEREKCKL